MKKLFFAFLFLPLFSFAQTPNYTDFCNNIVNTPSPEMDGDTLYMYITCAVKDEEHFESFVRKYIMLMQFDDTINKGGYEMYSRYILHSSGLCQTWTVVFIKPKKKED